MGFTLPDAALIVVTAAFAGMGIVAIAAPLMVTRQFDIADLSAAGRNEVRAVYGGFGLAAAAALAFALAAPPHRASIAFCFAVALCGMAAGRIVSALIDRRLDAWPCLYLGVELAGAALLAYAA